MTRARKIISFRIFFVILLVVFGQNLFASLTDSDSDGIDDYWESIDGTDPNSANSRLPWHWPQVDLTLF